MIADGFFSHSSPNLFKPIRDTLLYHGDKYFLLADYADYVKCQERVNAEYKNADSWTRKSIINVANMGKFSSDRTIADYARDIWHVKPVHIKAG